MLVGPGGAGAAAGWAKVVVQWKRKIRTREMEKRACLFIFEGFFFLGCGGLCFAWVMCL